jgi:hypothetical protein
LGGFDDDVFFFFAVGVTSSILSVLFAASFAAVALTTIGGEAEFEEVVALAVWASQGMGDRHGYIL